jgi:hypothetical protein
MRSFLVAIALAIGGTGLICPSFARCTVVGLFALLADGREVQLNGHIDYASIPIVNDTEPNESDTGWELDLVASSAALLVLVALLFRRIARPDVAIDDRSLLS